MWFWTYNFFVVWILFNMVIAIIMDAYVEVKSHVDGHSKTVWGQSLETVSRWRKKRRGEWVPLTFIHKTLHCGESFSPLKTDEAQDARVNVQELADMVPGLTTKEARFVLEESQRRIDKAEVL